ncbi:poly-like [Scleropages formosus]|uniref:Poly [ADP-ribose] polymerase n=1 Tax=Scleropages formosus TaxID=113540 RepID=A0A0N8JYU5_SCLFO|nr:poly-like [Scleropages formosus]
MLVAPLQCLSTVRLVVTKINVFLEFKRCLQTHFGVVQPRKASRGKSQEVKTQPSPRPDLGPLWNLGQVHSSTKLLVIGLCNEAVASAMQKLKQAYEDHSYQQEMSVEELTTLTQEDIAELASKMAALGVQAELDRTQSGVLFLRGLRNAVEQACHAVESTIRKNLSKEVQKQKQDEIYAQVAWCFQEVGSNWERFPPQANYLLEKGDVSGAVKDGKGMQWTVDWGKMEATNKSTNQVAKLKRLENLPDFSLPLNWDSMPNGQLFQTFILNPSSSEYQQVRREFKKVSKTIIKIERIQNIRLRQSYEVLKKQLEDKNGPSCGAMERVLFHGTTSAACDSIQRTGFSRSFAGQNATKYGVGVYFAVDASYSEHPTYSIPEADESQRMFMALVLTGQHTLGTEDMKVPPQHSPLQSDRYDSLVNDLDNPKIFVVFHDSQAYPEYLITFK